MAVTQRSMGRSLVLSPQEPLVVGGHAEDFEARVQSLFRQGYRHLIIDLSGVPHIDSAGVRALVRGYTTSQRLNGTFRLAAPKARVLGILKETKLDAVFPIFDSVKEARGAPFPWRNVAIGVAGAVLCTALVWMGMRWPDFGYLPGGEAFPPAAAPEAARPRPMQPFIELLKLVAAALIGLLVTALHRPVERERPLSRSMEHAQTLLCVSGAMMMIIIGNSLVRAFGIAGAATIVRFRTPVDDPKDVTILFLLMGLGMAAGLGMFAVAGLGTAFLCAFLLALRRVGELRARPMMVEVVSEGREFPTSYVQNVFARNRVVFEPREISQGDEVEVKYHCWVDFDTALEDLSAQLMGDGSAGIKSVSWERPKRSETWPT